MSSTEHRAGKSRCSSQSAPRSALPQSAGRSGPSRRCGAPRAPRAGSTPSTPATPSHWFPSPQTTSRSTPRARDRQLHRSTQPHAQPARRRRLPVRRGGRTPGLLRFVRRLLGNDRRRHGNADNRNSRRSPDSALRRRHRAPPLSANAAARTTGGMYLRSVSPRQ